MIILTGGAGFIGSNLLKELNNRQIYDIVIVDDIDRSLKPENLENSKYREIVPINNFWQWEEQNKNLNIDTFFHLGACSDTLETDKDYLYENNVVYSQRLWQIAIKHDSDFIYASSAATYGDGSLGFSDDHSLVPKLKPLNLYGKSKHEFDMWVLKQSKAPPLWVGLKYFNVFGPGEAHKGRMASVLWHFLNQLKNGEDLKLFGPSHGCGAGEQKRDFIYVKDVVDTTLYFYENRIDSGLYNIGTGECHTFNALAIALILALDKEPNITYFEMPKKLHDSYQYFTQAEIGKLQKNGFSQRFTSLEEGVNTYINFLNDK